LSAALRLAPSSNLTVTVPRVSSSVMRPAASLRAFERIIKREDMLDIPISISISISTYLSISVSVYICLYLSIYLSIYLYTVSSLDRPQAEAPVQDARDETLYIYLSIYIDLYLSISVRARRCFRSFIVSVTTPILLSNEHGISIYPSIDVY